MLDHIDDLKKLTNEDVNNIVKIFNKSFPTAIDNPRFRSAFELALLLDIAQSLRKLNKKD